VKDDLMRPDSVDGDLALPFRKFST